MDIRSSSSTVIPAVQEANCLDSANNESQLLQNSDESELDTDEDLAWQLYEAEKEKLDIAVKHHQELSNCKIQIVKLRCEVEKGEAVRQSLEYELAVARKDAHLRVRDAEEELSDVKTRLVELQASNEKLQQKVVETEKAFHIAQQKWKEQQQRLANEKDDILRKCKDEYELLLKERTKLESVLQAEVFKALIARKLEHCIKDEVQKKIPTGNIKAHQLKTLIIDQQDILQVHMEVTDELFNYCILLDNQFYINVGYANTL